MTIERPAFSKRSSPAWLLRCSSVFGQLQWLWMLQTEHAMNLPELISRLEDIPA